MLKTIVDKIGSVIETPFLYGSFLPVLIFVSAVVGTFATVLGYEACLNWAVNRTATAATATLYPVAIAIALIVFAYILSALRPLILGFWTGQLPWSGPLGRILTAIARKQYDERKAQEQHYLDEIANRFARLRRTVVRQLPRDVAGLAPLRAIAAQLVSN